MIGTAGTVNTGAIDDLQALADLAAEEGLWFHVDGCIGALIAIAPDNAHRVAGMERADSVALDPHKWLHTPFEVGCALVRDATAHRSAFALHSGVHRGRAARPCVGRWLLDYGLQTTRGFRALKVWMAIKEHGIETFGRLIDQNIAQAQFLTRLIERRAASGTGRAHRRSTSSASATIRRNPTGSLLKALNTEIMIRLQEQGMAVISDTTIHGEHCLRVAINNHRTVRDDLQMLVRETVKLGNAIAAGQTE